MFLEAILLGLSTGTYCTMYCTPVLIPFLCRSEKQDYGRNAGLTGVFLLSRLAMYFILGAVFATLGLLVNEYANPILTRRLSAFAYFFCGLSLLLNSLKAESNNDGKCRCGIKKIPHYANDWVTAIVTGLAVGLHICPPLWTAIARSVFGGNGVKGFFYFIFFYAGTLPFFIPLLGIPFVTKRIMVIKRVARITQFCLSIYFMFFAGLIALIFG